MWIVFLTLTSPAKANLHDTDDIQMYGGDGMHCCTCLDLDPAKVSAVTATDVQHPGVGPRALLDEDPSTAWCFGEGASAVGQSVSFTFAEGVALAGVNIHGGHFANGVSLATNGRVRRLRIETGSRSSVVTLGDPASPTGVMPATSGPEDGPLRTPFEAALLSPPVADLPHTEPNMMHALARDLTLTVLDVYPGAHPLHPTCISEVELIATDTNLIFPFILEAARAGR